MTVKIAQLITFKESLIKESSIINIFIFFVVLIQLNRKCVTGKKRFFCHSQYNNEFNHKDGQLSFNRDVCNFLLTPAALKKNKTPCRRTMSL